MDTTAMCDRSAGNAVLRAARTARLRDSAWWEAEGRECSDRVRTLRNAYLDAVSELQDALQAVGVPQDIERILREAGYGAEYEAAAPRCWERCRKIGK